MLAGLAYASVEDSEEAMVSVAKEIMETLNRFGIATQWNGRTDERSWVTAFDWKRRRNFDPAA